MTNLIELMIEYGLIRKAGKKYLSYCAIDEEITEELEQIERELKVEK